MYEKYKIARDKSWEVLTSCAINQLPVNLATIVNFYNIAVIKYSQSSDKSLTGDGFSARVNGRLLIYYNDIDYPITRQRFTIAHEIGHCLLGHIEENAKTFRFNSEIDEYKDKAEIQANIFARDLLMPATVLHSLKLNSAQEIADMCNISMQSAEIRFNRLLELEKRNMFNKHPFERQVFENFKEYINKNKV